MYVRTPSHLYRHHLYRKALSRVPVEPFLDVGTGYGDVALYLARRGARGVALDYGPEAVGYVSERLARYKNVGVVEGDFAEYEPDESIALVTLLEILEHVEDDRAFLAKAAGVLKPGGRILLSVPARMSLWDWRDDAKGHLRRYERDGLADLVRAAGLEDEVFWCWGWPFISALRRLTGKARLPAEGETEDRTKASGVRSEMRPWTGLFLNRVTTAAAFGFMDLFLGGDNGVGYVVLARKP